MERKSYSSISIVKSVMVLINKVKNLLLAKGITKSSRDIASDTLTKGLNEQIIELNEEDKE